MNFLEKLYVTVFPEAWNCAVRFNVDSETCLLNNTQDPFTVLPNTRRYWTADPFLYQRDDRLYVFFEVFDRLKRKGLLGYREITGGNIGEIKVIYEAPYHLSYPFIFDRDGETFIIPESNKGNELFLLRCVSFPDQWVKERVLLNEKLADTTVFTYESRDYYLTEKVDDSNSFDRLDLYYESNGVLIECAHNPVKFDANTARCAGKFFLHNGKYIRPSQDCGKAYGEKLNFNALLSLSQDGYSEELIKTVSHKDIHLDVNNNFSGIHTYNKSGNVEIIDLKWKRKFNLLNFIGIFYKAIRRFLHN